MNLNNKAIKRIAKDVKYILNNEDSLSSENIYYKHDEENIFKGYALIIGQKDTPYGYGYYFFEFIFPDNYPFSPPVVRYLTNDGIMRFNPNLYANGKVCLSILNTWSGESWTSCQSINSILLILSSVLCENPLLNEPGIQENHSDFEKYNYLVTYKNVEFSIVKIINYVNNYINNDINYNKNECKILNKNIKISKDDICIMHKFKLIINDTYKNNKNAIIDYLNNNKEKYSKFINKESNILETNKKNRFNLYISIYNLNYCLDYNNLYNLINNISFT